MEQFDGLLGCGDVALDDDTLDRIDKLVPPGTNIESRRSGLGSTRHRAVVAPAATGRLALTHDHPFKVDAEAGGLDATRLERITDHITRQYIDTNRIAGCQVAVARHGSVGYFRSFGDMDRERGTQVRDDTIWRIFSMTKPITGVALMTLYERGLFQLSDPVARFIPRFADLKVREVDADGVKQLVEPRRPMTVRDAMMHTTGFGWGGRNTPFAVARRPASTPSPRRSSTRSTRTGHSRR